MTLYQFFLSLLSLSYKSIYFILTLDLFTIPVFTFTNFSELKSFFNDLDTYLKIVNVANKANPSFFSIRSLKPMAIISAEAKYYSRNIS